MTIKELIEQLSKLDPNMEAVIATRACKNLLNIDKISIDNPCCLLETDDVDFVLDDEGMHEIHKIQEEAFKPEWAD